MATGDLTRIRTNISALNALQDFKRSVSSRLQLVHPLELVRDPEDLTDNLHGGTGAARSRFPPAKHQQPVLVQTWDSLDRRRHCGRRGA